MVPLTRVEVDQRVRRAGAGARPARSTRATRARRSWPPTPALRARRRRGTCASRPGRPRGCPSGAATRARASGSSLCQKPFDCRRRRESGAGSARRPARYGSAIGAICAAYRTRSRLVTGFSPPRAGNSTLSRLVTRSSPAVDVPRARRARRRPVRRARRRSGRIAALSARPTPRSAGRSERQSRSGSAVTSSLVRPVSTDRGWSSASQPSTASSSCLCSSSHCSFSPSRAVACGPARTGRAASRRAASTCSSPSRPPRRGSSVLVRLPGAAVPDDDVAAAVLAGRDHALEVGVVERVVLDVDRRRGARPGRASGPSAPPS